MSNYQVSAAFTFPRFLNTLGLVGVTFVLAFAFVWQFAYNELPCPLCLLQRVAFMLVGIGFLLNARFGSSPVHYGITILSAIGGAIASGRQTLLHIAPGDPGYGSPFLGLHFYTWALILFVIIIAYCAIMLMLDRTLNGTIITTPPNSTVRFIMWLFVLIIIGNFVSTFLECGLGACPDNPIEYLMFK